MDDINQFLDNYTAHAALLSDLLDSCSDQDLLFRVGSNMGPLGRQFRHIADVTRSYTLALSTGTVDFSLPRSPIEIEGSVAELKKLLKEVDSDLQQALATQGEITDQLTRTQHLQNLLEHTMLHEGELVVYFRVMGKAFPESWSTWGL